MNKFIKKYKNVITIPNILLAWEEFLPGKRKRNDVAIFQSRLMDNVLSLYYDLKNKNYKHSEYQAFNISDPKPRNIHKAIVRDRLLHHLLYREIYPYFDKKFIYDSYSCRINKGTHKAIYRLADFSRQVSTNHTKTVWVLKCDIRRFFASINHGVLKNILVKYIEDRDLLWLFNQVVDSFHTDNKVGTGLPLGNLTSQLLVNVYMNELDQFVKRDLKVRYYIRYADDFVFLSQDKNYLINLQFSVCKFLKEKLKLFLHPNKVFLKTIASGVDFLGWNQFVNYRVLRTITKKRMLKRVQSHYQLETINSYFGLLKHGNTHKLKQEIIAKKLFL